MATIVPLRVPTWALPPARIERRHVSPSRGVLTAHGTRLLAIVAAACLAIFLDASTSYESSTALPYIAGAVAATPDQASWIVTLFNAAYDTSILLSPWFLARFGRRRTFVGAALGFATFSLACAGAPGYAFFLVARVLQGFALGAFFACGVLALFMSIPGHLRLIGIMLFSMASQMGSAIGPAVAGYLVYVDAWPWVFVMNAALALVLAAGVTYALRDPAPAERVPFDWSAAFLIAVAFITLQYVVNEGERRNWFDDPWIGLALFSTPLFAAAIAIWKFRFSRHPFLDFRVLRHRNLVVGAIFGAGFGVLLQVATQIGGFVEAALGFTPTLGGGLDALRAIAIVVFVPIVTFAMAERWLGTRAALLAGLAITFAGFRLEVIATTAGADFGSFVAAFAAIGAGIAVLYRALATVIFGSLPPEDLIMGLLVYKISGVLGGALAVPALATLLDHLTAKHMSDIAGAITLQASPVRDYVQSHGSVAALSGMADLQASTLAYSDLWSIGSLVVLALVPVILAIDLRANAA